MTSIIGQLFKNIFTSWMGMVITIGVTFFFTPYLISELGKGQYGIWSLVFSLVAYLKLADVGMNQAIARYCSKYFALEDWTQLNQVVTTAARIYVFISIAIVAISAAFAYGILQHFQIDPEQLRIARITLILIGLNQAVTYMFIPYAALLPFHRADIVNYFDILQLLLQTLAIVIMLESGYGLVAMSLVIIGLNVVSHLGRYGIRKRMFPKVRFSIGAVTSEKTKQLLSYGVTSLLIVAAWIVVFQTDNIVIGRFISMEGITLFAVPAAMVTQLRNSINAIAVPLVPTISHIEAEKDNARIMEIYIKSSRYLYYLSGFIGVMLLVFGGPFILLWVGEDFTPSIPILHLLAIPACIYLPQMVANSVLFGVSKHKLLLYILAAEGLSNIGLSLLLVQRYGLIGVALGTAIPQLIIYAFVYPIAFYRVMESRPARFYKTAVRSILNAIVICLPVAVLLKLMIATDTWIGLLTDCGLVALLMLGGFVVLILDSEDRHRIWHKLRAWLSKNSGPPNDSGGSIGDGSKQQYQVKS